MTGDVRRTVRWNAKQLLLVLLALAPAVSTSRTPGDSGREASESFIAAHDGITGPSCGDLRDTELILASHEVQLVDELASEGARPDEREAWKGELDDTRTSLEDVDQALAAARCPPPPRGR